MRAVAYARFSSENQRDASIDDQLRLCRALIEQRGWTSHRTYSDRAMSGASALRPAYQRLLEDAASGAFDVVVAEALDRLTRDQADVAHLYKRLSFLGIRLVTHAEGEISELHIGLKGTMNALFLKDLAQKVRRGLEGRIREGRSGGGICFGYDLVREYDGRGEPVYGARKINEAEAAIVRRIFKEFAAGRSPRSIALALNRDGLHGPQGKPWGPSTIYGNWRRGTGIINNDLYIGKLIWNRQRFVKDPSTGRRQARPNPKSEWVVQDVPELRIIDDELWQSVKSRQRHIRHALTHDDAGIRSERARRPVYLLSHLLTCGTCGGGFSKVSANHYGCSNARNRGTCDNLLTIRRDVLEASVLSGLKTHLMEPELVKEFVAECRSELNRLNAGRHEAKAAREEELARIERQIRAIVEAIRDGFRTAAMKDELLALEGRKEQLAAAMADTPAEPPALHPELADVYRCKVANIQEELNRPGLRTEAAEAIRSLIDEVKLTPENGRLEIDLAGDPDGILALTSGKAKPASSGDGLVPVTLVAGIGFEPMTFRL